MMNKKLSFLLILIVGLVAVAGVYQFRANRLTKDKLAEVIAAEKRLDAAEAQEKATAQKPATPATTSAAVAATPASTVADPAAASADTAGATASEQTPDVFKVQFECSNGTFVVECHRDWAPVGVQQFYKLVQSGYYDNNRFFRVADSPAVVQFGLNGDPAITRKWRMANITDDPVKQSNIRGTICFAAMSMPNSRTTQLFINRGDNTGLDGMGFAVFGKVISGMEIVDGITNEYGQQPKQAEIMSQGNAYLEKNFPRMDYIKKAQVIQ